MKKKPKRKISSRPPTLTQKIASCGNDEERNLLAINGGFLPKTEAEGVVFAWLGVRKLESFGEHITAEKKHWFRELAERLTIEKVRSAMTKWDPEFFSEIASVMKLRSEIEHDPMTVWLLEAAKQGPVNVTKLAQAIEKNTGFKAELRTWQDRAVRLKIPTISPGRPNTQL